MKFCNTFLLTLLLLSCWTKAAATCGDTQSENGGETYSGNTCQTSFSKIVHWKVYWMDGYERDVNVTDTGTGSNIFGFCSGCFPAFNTPVFEEVGNAAYWDQVTSSGAWDGNGNCAQSGTHPIATDTHVAQQQVSVVEM